jgi:ssDNA-binding Zn-finger/Zn-ribbon topoisomerase 1
MSDYEIGKNSPSTNQHAKATDCPTCGGDKFVTVRLRSQEQTMWMKEHVILPNPNSFHEEVAACPDCHTNVDASYFTGGRKFRPMDPAAVRDALRS